MPTQQQWATARRLTRLLLDNPAHAIRRDDLAYALGVPMGYLFGAGLGLAYGQRWADICRDYVVLHPRMLTGSPRPSGSPARPGRYNAPREAASSEPPVRRPARRRGAGHGSPIDGQASLFS